MVEDDLVGEGGGLFVLFIYSVYCALTMLAYSERWCENLINYTKEKLN